MLALAETGDPEAQNALGRFYAQGSPDAKSTEIAEAWFRRAADQGLASAMHNLGVLSLRAGRQDFAQGWFRLAAAKGWLPSVFALGTILERTGQEQHAMKLYESAARRGHADAQDALGRMLFELETEEGYRKSTLWSELAAAQGLASAEARLGTIYHEGLAVERDPRRAASFFLRAAQSGHAGAQLMIGVAHHLGTGIEGNRQEAAFWLSRSAAQGNDYAHAYLSRVEADLTQDDKMAVEARLREPITR